MLKQLTIAAVAASLIALSPLAMASGGRMVGTVQQITMAADGNSAAVVVRNIKGGAEVTVAVSDKETIDKFKDKRIGRGDEVRVRFDEAKGNQSISFKKTAGC